MLQLTLAVRRAAPVCTGAALAVVTAALPVFPVAGATVMTNEAGTVPVAGTCVTVTDTGEPVGDASVVCEDEVFNATRALLPAQ